jgi:antitoxin (DNA-binding transcriptional repressor) of toxin-antitoxin stability system
MKTLTVTKARQNLGAWLARAVNGEDVGIIDSASGEIIALRPVKVYSEDYASTEYGLTAKEMERFEKKTLKKLKREKFKRWDGTVKGLRG